MRRHALIGVMAVWTAATLGCGDEPRAAARALTTIGDGGSADEPPTLGVSRASGAYTRLGDPESTGHRAESRSPGERGATPPIDDGVCTYVCAGLRACVDPRGDGTCDVCDVRVAVRDECRVLFEGLQSCLGAFDCRTVQQAGIDQLLAGCGVDTALVETCALR